MVVGPLLSDYLAMIHSSPCHLIVLLPSLETVAAREKDRHAKGYTGQWTVERHYDEFIYTTPRLGLWLDTTNLTPKETVEQILAGSHA